MKQKNHPNLPVLPKKKDLSEFLDTDVAEPGIAIFHHEDKEKNNILINKFQATASNEIKNIIVSNKHLSVSIDNYTSSLFENTNRFLGTEYLNKILLEQSNYDFFDPNLNVPKDKKINIPEKFEDFFGDIVNFLDEILDGVDNINEVLSKVSLPQNVLLFRGLPIHSSTRGEYKSDFWLRKEYLVDGKDLSLNIDGEFQKEMRLKVIKEKVATLNDFYRVGETIETKTLFSTSLSRNTADSFGSAKYNFGHLLIIKGKKGSPGIYVDSISSCPGEQEVILPMNAPLRLDRVSFRDRTELERIIKMDDIKGHSAHNHSLCFFFTYDDPQKTSSKLNKEKIKKDVIFWKNISKLLNNDNFNWV